MRLSRRVILLWVERNKIKRKAIVAEWLMIYNWLFMIKSYQ
jgi:hypothetical protein